MLFNIANNSTASLPKPLCYTQLQTTSTTMSNTFNTLCSLKSEKVVYCIRVRAQAVWKGINRKTNEFRGFNIIFTDEQVASI